MELDNFEVNNIYFDKPLNNTVIKNSLLFSYNYLMSISCRVGDGPTKSICRAIGDMNRQLT